MPTKGLALPFLCQSLAWLVQETELQHLLGLLAPDLLVISVI